MSELFASSWPLIAALCGIAILVIVAVYKVISHIRQKGRTNDPPPTSRPRQPRPAAPASPAASTRLSVRSQTETGPMIYYADNPHRCRDNEYRFNYKKIGDCWRAYILQMPSLRNRDTSLHATHRHTDCRGTYWICWDKPVKSLEDMQTISRVWANSIQEYIATGKRFGPQ